MLSFSMKHYKSYGILNYFVSFLNERIHCYSKQLTKTSGSKRPALTSPNMRHDGEGEWKDCSCTYVRAHDVHLHQVVEVLMHIAAADTCIHNYSSVHLP